MLAVRAPRITRDRGWAYEIKWDGVRTLAYWDGVELVLRSRRGRSVTSTYPELGAVASGQPVILDGEIVALDETGRPSFERLQGRMNVRDRGQVAQAVEQIPITFVVFDLLFQGNAPVIEEPWTQRRHRLESLELGDPAVVSQVVDDIDPLWEFVRQRGIEGVVAKRRASPYRPGVRSDDWKKRTVVRTMRAVIGGYTVGEGGRHGLFGSLLMGLWDGDRLRWIGAVGTGFSNESLRLIRGALDQMVVAASPFHRNAEVPRDVVWVDPQLVAVIEFKEWTSYGRLRAPSFKGFSDDPVDTVTWENEGPQSTG